MFTLRQWVIDIIALAPDRSQSDLFLEVKTSDIDPNKLDHDVLISVTGNYVLRHNTFFFIRSLSREFVVTGLQLY